MELWVEGFSLAQECLIGIRVVGMVFFLKKIQSYGTPQRCKFSATKAHGVKGSQVWQGRREYSSHNLRGTLNKITIGYKSVKIGNKGDLWALWRHGNKQSCALHEAD